MSAATAFGALATACTVASASLRGFTMTYAPPRGSDDVAVLLLAAWPDMRQRFARLSARHRNDPSVGPVRPDEEPTP